MMNQELDNHIIIISRFLLRKLTNKRFQIN